jgi:hypothetical protein
VIGALVSGGDDEAESGPLSAAPAPAPAATPAVTPATITPAPSPAVDPAPRAVPTPAPTPAPDAPPPPADLSGLWRTNTGETYHFEQQGRDVRFTARSGGQPMGEGVGRLEGGLLRLSLTMQLNGVVLGSANCDLQRAPDGRSYTGMCMGPNGPFAAQMFR